MQSLRLLLSVLVGFCLHSGDNHIPDGEGCQGKSENYFEGESGRAGSLIWRIAAPQSEQAWL